MRVYLEEEINENSNKKFGEHKNVSTCHYCEACATETVIKWNLLWNFRDGNYVRLFRNEETGEFHLVLNRYDKKIFDVKTDGFENSAYRVMERLNSQKKEMLVCPNCGSVLKEEEGFFCWAIDDFIEPAEFFESKKFMIDTEVEYSENLAQAYIEEFEAELQSVPGHKLNYSQYSLKRKREFDFSGERCTLVEENKFANYIRSRVNDDYIFEKMKELRSAKYANSRSPSIFHEIATEAAKLSPKQAEHILLLIKDLNEK